AQSLAARRPGTGHPAGTRVGTRTAGPARPGPRSPRVGRPALDPVPDQPPHRRALRHLLRRPVGVWRMLDRLGWSWQVLAARAAERDEQEVTAWRTRVWPRTKEGR